MLEIEENKLHFKLCGTGNLIPIANSRMRNKQYLFVSKIAKESKFSSTAEPSERLGAHSVIIFVASPLLARDISDSSFHSIKHEKLVSVFCLVIGQFEHQTLVAT